MSLNPMNFDTDEEALIKNLGLEIYKTCRRASERLADVDETSYLSNLWFGRRGGEQWIIELRGKINHIATIMSSQDINVYGAIPSEDEPGEAYPRNVKFNIDLDLSWYAAPKYSQPGYYLDVAKYSKFHILVYKLSQILLDTCELKARYKACKDLAGSPAGALQARRNSHNWAYFVEDYREEDFD